MHIVFPFPSENEEVRLKPLYLETEPRVNRRRFSVETSRDNTHVTQYDVPQPFDSLCVTLKPSRRTLAVFLRTHPMVYVWTYMLGHTR